MKLFTILVLLSILALFIWRRYRQHIESAIYIYKMFKKTGQMKKAETPEKQIQQSKNVNDVQLVRCAKCGSWIGQTKALKFGRNSFYCSVNCMEKNVILPTKHTN